MTLIMKRLSLPVMASMLMFTGCATILNDTTQRVNLSTSNGAKISAMIDGQTVEAPGIVAITRSKSDKIITTSNPNCAPQTIAAREIDPIFFINVVSGGAFGSTTDYSTEKMWRYSQNIMINCK